MNNNNPIKLTILCGILVCIVAMTLYYTYGKDHHSSAQQVQDAELLFKDQQGADHTVSVKLFTSYEAEDAYTGLPEESVGRGDARVESSHRVESRDQNKSQSKKERSMEESVSGNAYLNEEQGLGAKPSSSDSSSSVSTGNNMRAYSYSSNESLSEKSDEYNNRDSDQAHNNVNIIRVIESGSVAQGQLEVLLMVEVAHAPRGLIVEELIPSGWSLNRSDPEHKFINSSNKVTWLFIGSDVSSRQIRYTLTRNGPSEPSVAFSGEYTYNSMVGTNVKRQTVGAERV